MPTNLETLSITLLTGIVLKYREKLPLNEVETTFLGGVFEAFDELPSQEEKNKIMFASDILLAQKEIIAKGKLH